jgi:hypothetical protein
VSVRHARKTGRERECTPHHISADAYLRHNNTIPGTDRQTDSSITEQEHAEEESTLQSSSPSLTDVGLLGIANKKF